MPELTIHSKLDLNYTDDGPADSAHVLLLFNGSTLPLGFWNPLVETLGTDHRIVRFDQRNAGLTHYQGSFSLNDVAADAATLLAHLDIDTAVVVGHAWGGRVAQVFARDYPHLTRGLIICGTGGQLPARVPGETLKGMRENSNSGDRINWEKHLEDAFCSEGFSQRDPDAFKDIADLLWASKPHREARWDPQISPSDSYWGRSAHPGLLIYGTEDKNGTPENARHLHDRLTGSRLEFIERAGHFVICEAPVKVDQLIRGFTRELTP